MPEPLKTLGKWQNDNDMKNRAQRVRVPHRPPFAMLRISTFSSLSALSHALVPTFCPHLAQSPVPLNRLHTLHRLGPSRTGRRRHPMSSPYSCAPAYTAMDATVWRRSCGGSGSTPARCLPLARRHHRRNRHRLRRLWPVRRGNEMTARYLSLKEVAQTARGDQRRGLQATRAGRAHRIHPRMETRNHRRMEQGTPRPRRRRRRQQPT